MALDITVPPAAEPLTLEEGRTWLRIDGPGDDGLLAPLIAAARGAVEAACGRRLLRQQWRWTIDRWPPASPLPLPLSPVVAVTEVNVATGTGTVVVPPADWVLAAASDKPRLVFLRPPPAPATPAGGIVIVGFAGLADTPAALPEAVRQAVRMTLAALWENRGDAAIAAAVPPAAMALLEPFRRIRL
jgi:uncharacterized phiE125 gp8 family phage protein